MVYNRFVADVIFCPLVIFAPYKPATVQGILARILFSWFY